jgi:hypothetical protein
MGTLLVISKHEGDDRLRWHAKHAEMTTTTTASFASTHWE